MNEEIKESIKHIQDIVDFYKLNDENNYDYSDKDLISMKTLLNYITNLQEENQKLVKVIDDLKNRLENAVADCNLRIQENQKLVNVIDGLERFLKYEIYCNFNEKRTEAYEDSLNKLTELKGGSDNEC